MAWDKGFNFRNTSGYVTDLADETYVTGDVYPTTRNGVTFGWAITHDANLDLDAAIDRRLAGVAYAATQAIFRVDLPGIGDYSIRIALGYTTPSPNQYLEIRDGATPLHIIDLPAGNAAYHWFDAAGTDYTNVTWPGSNAQVGLTFTGVTLNIALGMGLSTSLLSHVFVSQGPPTIPDPVRNRRLASQQRMTG